MKCIFLIISFFISIPGSFSQDSLWMARQIDNVCSFQLPRSSVFEKIDIVHFFEGELNKSVFGVQFFDSVFNTIHDSDDYRVALLGFVDGRTSDPSFASYNIMIKDTTIAGVPGVFANLMTTDSVHQYKQVLLFLLMAENRFCCFFQYLPEGVRRDKSTEYFFNSISFGNLKERKFRLEPILLLKKGK